MSGGSEIVASTTNYVFGVSYTSSAGRHYQDFWVKKLKPENNEHGYRESEWTVYLSSYMEEMEHVRLIVAFDELEAERETVRKFNELSAEEKTIADIWGELKEANRDLKIWKGRAEKAEGILYTLNDIWVELERKRWGKEHEVSDV